MNSQLTTAFLRTGVIVAALVALAATVAIAGAAAPERGDIEDQYKWNLNSLFQSKADWEKAYSWVEANMSRLADFKGKLGDSPETLLACLRLEDSLNIVNDNVFVYAGLLIDQDQRVTENQELQGRAQGLNSRLGTAGSFIQPEILTISGDRLQSFLKSTPELDEYRPFLDDLQRSKAHILSPDQEEILSLAGTLANSPRDIFDMICNADLKFGNVMDENGEEVELTRQRYAKMLESFDRDLRRRANRTYVDAYFQHENALAASLGAAFQRDWYLTQARNYEKCVDRRLDEYNIPEEVFYSLIKAVDENLAPLHKWVGLRKRILKLDTLYTYDLSVPLLDRKPREFTWDEAKQTVQEGLKPLGETYLTALAKGLEGGWIDVYENKGKATGAYNWGTYTSHPYVMMNFAGTRDNVFTLAHEMGHAMHAHYSHANETYRNSDHSLFTAEVASTTNEAILMKYLLEHCQDKQEKLELLLYYIDQIEGTFFTQVFFSEFELAMHEHVEQGGAFSSRFFRDAYRELYEKYWGPELVIDSLNDMGCLRISHFYRNFYVFQYATGYASAQMIAQRILDKEPGGQEALMNFLKRGSSKYPMDILRDAGVDLTDPEPYNRTIKVFSDLVDEVERLLNEG